ncbi:hypothetical protein V6N12_065300 [Hibiscus sabdariffa]|uniref:CCHC-type domain-containing protein n=1 Tax=Hibiscus sabdariffa TaxID=183260 RepID=A0ABR2G8A9_9ROSI
MRDGHARCFKCGVFGHADKSCQHGDVPLKVWVPKQTTIDQSLMVKGKEVAVSPSTDPISTATPSTSTAVPEAMEPFSVGNKKLNGVIGPTPVNDIGPVGSVFTEDVVVNSAISGDIVPVDSSSPTVVEGMNDKLFVPSDTGQVVIVSIGWTL